jgi:hypothetical protein
MRKKDLSRQHGRPAGSTRHALRRSARAADVAAGTMRDLGEMQLAAARTIGLRVPMIAAAMRDPRLLADPELARMVTEKVDAAGLVAAAAAPQLALPAVHAARWMSEQAALWSRTLADVGVLTPSPGGAWTRWQKVAEGVTLINAAYVAAMLGTMAELGRVTLAPVHEAAMANARRLGRGP